MFLSASDNSVVSTWLDRLGTEIFVTGHGPWIITGRGSARLVPRLLTRRASPLRS